MARRSRMTKSQMYPNRSNIAVFVGNSPCIRTQQKEQIHFDKLSLTAVFEQES